MSESTSNLPAPISNTDDIDEGISRITAQISKLDDAEDRTSDIVNRTSSLLHDILELQSPNATEKQRVSTKQRNSQEQRVSAKQNQLTACIKILNLIHEQSRSGYRLLYKQWGGIQSDDENEIAVRVEKLNRTHARNRQGIVALWRKMRDLQEEVVKMMGEEGVGVCSGVAWGDMLKLFSGMESGV